MSVNVSVCVCQRVCSSLLPTATGLISGSSFCSDGVSSHRKKNPWCNVTQVHLQTVIYVQLGCKTSCSVGADRFSGAVMGKGFVITQN